MFCYEELNFNIEYTENFSMDYDEQRKNILELDSQMRIQITITSSF